jgi:hypothetical protein
VSGEKKAMCDLEASPLAAAQTAFKQQTTSATKVFGCAGDLQATSCILLLLVVSEFARAGHLLPAIEDATFHRVLICDKRPNRISLSNQLCGCLTDHRT